MRFRAEGGVDEDGPGSETDLIVTVQTSEMPEKGLTPPDAEAIVECVRAVLEVARDRT